MFDLQLSDKAKKKLKKLDPRYASALAKAFDRLALDPYIGEPLLGERKGQWRLRFSQYRIIYFIFKKTLVVLIITVLHRKDAYRLG